MPYVIYLIWIACIAGLNCFFARGSFGSEAAIFAAAQVPKISKHVILILHTSLQLLF